MSDYRSFLDRKTHLGGDYGFSPRWVPKGIFDFQEDLTCWALEKGRGAVFADCGLGKTLMQLTWAQNVVEHTNGAVLVLTPLAVGAQTVVEGEKFGIASRRSRDGSGEMKGIIITNYEQLDKFSPSDFVGLVCDESSILKSFSGATQKAVTRFMSKLPYRLLCTATAAPNDYVELGTSSEALGELGMIDMLGRFFTQKENFHALHSLKKAIKTGEPTRGLVVAGTGNEWRMRPHAVEHFWQWVCSWARACRRPSDLGFEDGAFVLPALIENEHSVKARSLPPGMLFDRVAQGLQEEREERRRTMQERCEYVAGLVSHDQPAVIWCHLNDEGDLLEELIPGAVQISGADSDEKKEESFAAFQGGQIKKLITKPKIGAWGLNWQHAAHVVTFASHSYEQYYQSVRRCWRFGQTRPVTVDIVSSEGEAYVRENMRRKALAADAMFEALVRHMRDSVRVDKVERTIQERIPSWLCSTK